MLEKINASPSLEDVIALQRAHVLARRAECQTSHFAALRLVGPPIVRMQICLPANPKEPCAKCFGHLLLLLLRLEKARVADRDQETDQA